MRVRYGAVWSSGPVEVPSIPLIRIHRCPLWTIDAQSLLEAAGRAGILTGKSREQVEDLRRQWNVAVSTEPLTREAAERALVIARDILSTISLPGEGKERKPRL